MRRHRVGCSVLFERSSVMRCILLLVAASALLSLGASAAGSVQAAWVVAELGPGWPVAINERGQIVLSRGGHVWVWRAGRLRDLGRGSPTAINNRGVIVGHKAVGKGITHAFLWANGQAIDLGVLPGGTSSTATALNDHGQVVGSSGSWSGWGHAFVWQGGKMTDLGVLPGGRWSSASGINERGQVIGQSDSSAKQGHASWGWKPGRGFLWQHGVISDLGTANATDRNSDAVAIDQRGTVLAESWHIVRSPDGEKYDATYTHGFLWTKHKVTRLHGLRGYPNSKPTGLNESGQVVGCAVGAGGFYYDQTNGYRPSRWQNGKRIDLGHLDDNEDFGCAAAINSRGVIVGNSGFRAFAWQKGKITRLPALRGNGYTEAWAINDHGWIIGISRQQYDNGDDRAVLWTPRR